MSDTSKNIHKHKPRVIDVNELIKTSGMGAMFAQSNVARNEDGEIKPICTVKPGGSGEFKGHSIV